jgi:Cof subfamily protein (haloacid dehalogenase superfamily)
MTKIKLIATDIDGTILKHNFEFNPEVKDCIKDLTKQGVKVVLVTGRMFPATHHITKELGLDTPVVCYQGGLVKHNDEILYEKNLSPKVAKDIINWAKKNNIHTNLYLNDELYVETDSPTIQRYIKQGVPHFNIKPFDEVKLERINKMVLIDYEDENKVTMWKEYLEIKHQNVHFIKSTPHYCEVCHPEATKACAVNFLKDYWGLKTEEILTIGDQNNDIDLLSAGGIKVAMGNATEELKAVADYITETVNNNGFVKAVEKFVYNNIKI